MEYVMSYVPTTEIDELVKYYEAMKVVENYDANFGKAKLIDDFIEKLRNLDIEAGILK